MSIHKEIRLEDDICADLKAAGATTPGISLVDETLLRDEIIGTHPRQMALPFALWNRKAVQEARVRHQPR